MGVIHNYDVLAAKIEEIHRNFGLHGKISATVTDNGSNFIKAFNTFTVQEESRFDEAQIITDDDDEADDDVTFTDMHDVMMLEQNETDDLTQVEYELPPHQRCAAHTLNLVASTDVDKLLQSSISKSVYRSSFANCTALWNKTRRSTIAADKMNEKLKRKLLIPSPTC